MYTTKEIVEKIKERVLREGKTLEGFILEYKEGSAYVVGVHDSGFVIFNNTEDDLENIIYFKCTKRRFLTNSLKVRSEWL